MESSIGSAAFDDDGSSGIESFFEESAAPPLSSAPDTSLSRCSSTAVLDQNSTFSRVLLERLDDIDSWLMKYTKQDENKKKEK